MNDLRQSTVFPRVKLGVSSFLLGPEVRFDGGHKRDTFVVGSLSKFVDYMPICPEVAIGMGIPRRPIRLVGTPDRPKAVGTDEYLVMAHSQAAYQRMGRMLGDLRNVDLDAIALMYVTELMGALKRRVTRQRHANVLQHMAGYLKRSIDSGDKQELGQQIDAYRCGEVPLIVLITLFRHYFRRHPDPYMERQVYLHPHPDELSLRNAI